MKILHITNNYPTKDHPIYGIFVKEQIESLTNQGIYNEVFFINGRERGKSEYIKSVYLLKKFLNNRQFDIIHCHHALSAVCMILSGESRRYKTILSYQNDPSKEQGKILFRFLKKKCRAIILKNNCSIVNNNTTFYQPNGVNIDFFKPIDKKKSLEKLQFDNKKRYILFVSSNFVRQQKRYDRFQKVLQILRDKYKLFDIEEIMLVNIERSFVPYYFNAASLHLLTSDFEGSPNSVKEAMACNIPVVSTNVGNVSELLEGVNGSFVSKTSEPEELAFLAYQALTFKGEINSREKLIEKNLDTESVAKNIISIYKKIINE